MSMTKMQASFQSRYRTLAGNWSWECFIALEPEADYERRPDGGGGCEDPRMTYVEPLQRYIMSYTAFSPAGPRIAFAESQDLLHWHRLGLATYAHWHGIGTTNIVAPVDSGGKHYIRDNSIAFLRLNRGQHWLNGAIADHARVFFRKHHHPR